MSKVTYYDAETREVLKTEVREVNHNGVFEVAYRNGMLIVYERLKSNV